MADSSGEMRVMSKEDLKPENVLGKKLSDEFYLKDVLVVARRLIGKILVRKLGRKVLAGAIVETEAYMGSLDAASHSFRGKTKRNEAMFRRGGVCYVYFTYGNHYCMNVVTGKTGVAHAALIRALEPIAGIDDMKKRRNTEDVHNLASGPGKLTQALEIDKRLNGVSFAGNELYIVDPRIAEKIKVLRSKRIGITKNADKLWRFYAADNPFVSRVNAKSILMRLQK